MRSIGLAAAAAILLSQIGPAMAATLVLREGTDIHLATRGEISSETAKEGDRVDFAVQEAVVVDGVTVIPAGTSAVGEVTKAKGNGLLGRSGKLAISVSYVDAQGRQIPVRGDRGKKGTTGAPGMVGAAIVFLPLGLIVKGKEAKIKAGTPVEVYVAQDVPVETVAQQERPLVVPVPAPGG